jgi:CheY-like chemotaxis protein
VGFTHSYWPPLLINFFPINSYSLILTDQYMPECDGFAAVTQIRAYFAASATPNSPSHARSLCDSTARDSASVVQNPGPVRHCPKIVVCTGTYEGRLTEVMDDILIKPVRFKTITYLPLFCFRFSIFDFRFSIFDFRFSIFDFRFSIFYFFNF